MLSQTARYALIIMGHLVDAGERWQPVDLIARETCVPANYLSKILNRLAKEDVVESLKGWGGGYRVRPASLARPIRDVLAIIDGKAAGGISGCVFGFDRCDEAAPCPLHAQWSRLRESYERMLAETRVGDLGARADAVPRRRPCAGRAERSRPPAKGGRGAKRDD